MNQGVLEFAVDHDVFTQATFSLEPGGLEDLDMR